MPYSSDLYEFYKRDPAKFLEETLGIKLLGYQKFLLKHLCKTRVAYWLLK